MIKLWFFDQIDPTPPTDGVFYGAGLARRYGSEEWILCEMHISDGEATQQSIVGYPADELGFRRMLEDARKANINALFVSQECLHLLSHYAERRPDLFEPVLDQLGKTTRLPKILLDQILEGQGRSRVH